MTGLLHEDVLRLQVSVNNPLPVEVAEGADDLRQVEADDGGGEDAVALEAAEDVEVAAGAVGDPPADELLVLRGAYEVRQERMSAAAAEAAQDGDFVARAAVGVVMSR